MIPRFRLALAFLTRLPGGRHPNDSDQIASAVAMFPVVGVLVGLLGATVGLAAATVLPSLTAAALAFAVTALATGGFHEDGLADSFDGLAGGWTREQRLEILKDSRHGTFGVLSILLVTLVKVSAWAAVLEAVQFTSDLGLDSLGAESLGSEPLGSGTLAWWWAGLVLVAAHSGGRGAAVALMGVTHTARADGLGAEYTRALGWTTALVGGLIGTVVVVAVLSGAGRWWLGPVGVGVTAVALVVLVLWARAKIGGMTGDLLGAAEQIAECTILCTATLAI